MPNKKFYITTSIPYTNAPPHIGFALEAVQADVLARYHRALGDDVFYLTGTDEHGIKILRAAREAGKEPKDFADELSQRFKSLMEVLNISNSDFIRTTDERVHKPTVEKVWRKLKQNGDIYKKKYKGFYCAGCEAFVPEKDLVDGKCKIHQKNLELVEEENYFFKLSKYTRQIEKLIEKDKLEIVPETRKNEILSMLKQGIEDVSFSRIKDKYWGFSVPDDPSQIIYVWCDALPNYISAIGYLKESEQFKRYWPADVHCIGKDIMKFHTIFWPAMLLSLGLKPPKTIFVHGFITVAGQKMSKSLGNVVDPFELVKKYGTDAVRYYLLREIPAAEDGDFTYKKFEERYNSDLASGIGNLLARVKTLAEKVGFSGSYSKDAKKNIDSNRRESSDFLEKFRFHEALKNIWDIIGFCDRYVDKEKPWEAKGEKTKIKNQKVINDLLFALDAIADMLKPFLPETAVKISKELERDEKKQSFKNKRTKALFPKINKAG